MFACQIVYTGRVQGVGFRYSTKQIATGFEITGHVRNLSDGRVELFAQSLEPEELEAFLLAIEESNLAALIKEAERLPADPEQDLDSFSIR
jgi:acylphosphatase